VTLVGELALWTALFLAAWACAVSFAGAVLRRPDLAESGARAVVACGAMVAVACVGLWAALLGHDFSLEYVAAHTTMNAPRSYLVAAFWAGLQGLVLWWSLSMAACAGLEVRRGRRDPLDAAWTAGTLGGVAAISLVVVCFALNPFDRAEWIPGDGRGFTPALQSGWAVPHFATTYPAYAAATVMVVVVASHARRHGLGPWTASVRTWSLAAWCLLTAGLASGMRWRYTEPSLGGDWSWDTAQSSRLLHWLVIAALVRSLVVGGPRAPSGMTRRRAPAMYGVYLGVAILLVGLAARGYWTDEVIRVQPGQAAALADPFGSRWRFVSQGASRDERANYLSTGVAVEAWRGARAVGIINAERRQYLDSGQGVVAEPTTKPGVKSYAALDVYLLLAEMRGELAVLRVSFRPLVSCVWIGWALILLSAIFAAAQLTIAARQERRALGPA